MTIANKSFKLFVYPLIIGICLVVSIGLLYINFSDFVMPYALVVGLLIICALVSLGSYIGYARTPTNNSSLYAKLWRIILLAILGVTVIILIALPVLVIENA